MLTRPKARGHFRFSSQLNDGSTQFNAYQNSFFERGQVLVEKARTRSLWGVEPRTKAICKVETTKDIVDSLVDFYNLVFYFIKFRLVSTRAILPLCTRANFAVFAMVCHIEITISPWGTGSSQEKRANIVAYNQGLNAIEFRICSSGSSGVIQVLVRSMIPPFAPHAALCPIRVFIPLVNSKQPA